MTTKKTVTPELYETPGVRASISTMISAPATDAWKAFLQQIAREYRPLTDTQAHTMCLKIHDEQTPAAERTSLRATLAANCAPLAAQAARDFASQFGGDWRASAMAALEIMQAQLPGMRESVSRKGEVSLVPTGYKAAKALLNVHGWIITSFGTEMVKKAQANRAAISTTTAEDIAFAKKVWASALDRLGNWLVPRVNLAPKTVFTAALTGSLNGSPVLVDSMWIEWGKLDVAFDFSLRPVRREEVSVSVYGLQAVTAAATAEIHAKRARALTEKAAEIEKLVTGKGYTLDRAIGSVTNKETERPRRVLKALAETPSLLNVWLSGQARPESIDAAKGEDGDTSLAATLEAPEALLPRFTAQFAQADLLTARRLLERVGNSALLMARADVRDLTRTAAQCDREVSAQQEWEDLCAEVGISTHAAARDARALLYRAGARFAEQLSDDQVDVMKELADEWNDGFEKHDRIPYLKLVFGFRRYGKRLGDALPHWRTTMRHLNITGAQGRHLVRTVDAMRPVRSRKATGTHVTPEQRRAYALFRQEVNTERAFLASCEKAGVSFHAGQAIARHALNLTGLRFTPVLGQNADTTLKSVTDVVRIWIAEHEEQLGVSDRDIRRLDLVALSRAFHAFGIASGGHEALERLGFTPNQIEAALQHEQQAAQEVTRPAPTINLTRRAIQHEAERELHAFDERGAAITRALMNLHATAHRPLGDDWYEQLQDTVTTQQQYAALKTAHVHFLLSVQALEDTANGGNVLLIAEASLIAEEAARYCEAIIHGDPLNVTATQARHIAHRRVA